MSESKQTSGKNAPGGFSPETEAIVEKKINELLNEQLNRAKKLISENDDKMKNLLSALKDKQYLTEKEIIAVINIM